MSGNHFRFSKKEIDLLAQAPGAANIPLGSLLFEGVLGNGGDHDLVAAGADAANAGITPDALHPV